MCAGSSTRTTHIDHAGQDDRLAGGHSGDDPARASVLRLRTDGPRVPSRSTKAAIKKALNSGRYILTGHNYPARVEGGRVVQRISGNVIPGPGTPVAEWTPPPHAAAGD